MPSDFAPIAQTICVGCGRPSITVSESGVALKRLNTYSRAFGCLQCFLKYANCANCGHEKHKSSPDVLSLADAFYSRGRIGKCYCGCAEYRHGLEAEFDRQFDVHTGKTPSLQCARGCGRYRTRQPSGFTPLWCDECERDYRGLNA